MNRIDELNNEFAMQDDEILNYEKESKTHDYFQCPLCPGHTDDNDCAWSKLLNAWICRGCTYDIHFGLVWWHDQPTPENYNHASTIQMLIELTGHSFQQLKYQYLRDKILEWGGVIPDAYRIELNPELTETWLRIANIELDRVLVDLNETLKRKKEIENHHSSRG